MCTTEAVAQREVRHGREGSDEQGSFPGGGNDASTLQNRSNSKGEQFQVNKVK